MTKRVGKVGLALKAWVGFSDGHPHVYVHPYGIGEEVLEIYWARSEARKFYQDVRRVLMTPLPKRRVRK